MSSSTSSDERITVVLIDSTTPEALVKCVKQVARTGPECEIVVVTARATPLPPAIARRVRPVRVSSPEHLESAATTEASVAALVVVAPTSSSFTEGWEEAVRERARLHSQVISVVGTQGRSILVVPAPVLNTDGSRTTWLDAPGLRIRQSASSETGRQSLSAVMIVKNEEDVLDECLSALTPFVDQVVVYDTGSSDRTVDIARRHGAVVVEGYWNDHFGDARNRALDHATGDWVLQIDADEVMTGDVEALRRQLDTEPHDQVSLKIISTSFKGSSTGVESQPARFFRRGLYRWTGALHEYPLPLPGARVRGMSPLHPPVLVMHSGYQPERTADRDKTSRNLMLSSRELEKTPVGDPARATMLSNQGRTLMWAGRIDEALDVFDELRVTPGNPTTVVIGGRAALEAVLGRERFADVDPWLDVLAQNGESPGNIAVYRARRHLAEGKPDAAVQEINSIAARGGGGADIWGVAFDASRAEVVRVAATMSRGDADEATDLLLDLLRTSPDSVPFDLLITAMNATARPLEAATEAAPEAFLERSLRDAASTHPLTALAWFEAYFASHPSDLRATIAGNVFAPRAGWRVALVWAVRAVELGLADSTALHALAADTKAPRVERCVATALLSEYFAATEQADEFERLSSRLSSAEEVELLAVLAELGISASTIDVSGTLAAAGTPS